MHTGQKLYFRNVELEILYTHEDMYPWSIEYFNDTSTVARIKTYSTDGSGITKDMTPTSTSLWLGDAQMRASKVMRATYGQYLKSDIVQVSHHGAVGCEWELYQLTDPTYLLWPNSRETFQNSSSNPNNATEYKRINYKIANELKNVKFIVLGEKYNLTITIGKNGPCFNLSGDNALYDAAGSGTAIQYDGYLIKK